MCARETREVVLLAARPSLPVPACPERSTACCPRPLAPPPPPDEAHPDEAHLKDVGWLQVANGEGTHLSEPSNLGEGGGGRLGSQLPVLLLWVWEVR